MTCNKDKKGYLKNYSSYLSELLLRLDYGAVEEVIHCLLDARDRDATIFFAGNGGSAATASHFSQDLGEVGRKTGTKCFRTISLNDSVPYMTALGNDYGYDRIFAGQLEAHFRKGDVLIVISASGNSQNILESVKLANRSGGITIGLVGFDGGKLSGLCRHVVHTATKKGEYGPVEDVHLILNHMITTCIMSHGAKSKSKRKG
jgi:D-sedoheptulose 7-phosphate isomerase